MYVFLSFWPSFCLALFAGCDPRSSRYFDSLPNWQEREHNGSGCVGDDSALATSRTASESNQEVLNSWTLFRNMEETEIAYKSTHTYDLESFADLDFIPEPFGCTKHHNDVTRQPPATGKLGLQQTPTSLLKVQILEGVHQLNVGILKK
ncbi:hypothetical protein JB92DRAFT_2835171 [Gautieria morchelliformis]|nr:hypothetical protein JB92DRAFT_2835171 [Gautieria morchelliformis]